MGASFEILARTPLRESERVLYLLGPR
jgi:hypothetical protein